MFRFAGKQFRRPYYWPLPKWKQTFSSEKNWQKSKVWRIEAYWTVISPQKLLSVLNSWPVVQSVFTTKKVGTLKFISLTKDWFQECDRKIHKFFLKKCEEPLLKLMVSRVNKNVNFGIQFFKIIWKMIGVIKEKSPRCANFNILYIKLLLFSWRYWISCLNLL